MILHSFYVPGKASLTPSACSLCKDRLDPIDWATYEPYLWVKEAAYYQRCAVLVGSLSHLHPVHTGAAVKLPAAADTNAMNTTPAVPRFSYLPISQPQTGDKGKVCLNIDTRAGFLAPRGILGSGGPGSSCCLP